MAAAGPIETECGFCLQTDGDLEDPVRLPCSHVHCKSCLDGAYKVTKVIKCPTCSGIFDVPINSLSPADIKTDTLTSCDTCSKKGAINVPAITYCTTCSKKFCDKHKQFHDEVHDDHPCLLMDEYRAKSRKLEVRVCDEHEKEPYRAGCKNCLTLCCVKCLMDVSLCSDGASHQLTSIEELLTKITTDINKLKEGLLSKEGEISSLIKKTTAAVSEYESQTNRMIKFLHKTRDEQMKVIAEGYRKLEVNLLEQRKQVQTTMSNFAEERLDRELSQLNQYELRIGARLKHSHEVDIIKGYEKMKKEIDKLMNLEVPELLVKNVGLRKKGTNRNTELQIVQIKDVHINKTSAISAGSTTATNIPAGATVAPVCTFGNYPLLTTWKAPFDRVLSVVLSQHTPEYKNVAASFHSLSSWGHSVIQKISRIQNPTHYQKYASLQKEVALKLGKQDTQVETTSLWIAVSKKFLNQYVGGQFGRTKGGLFIEGIFCSRTVDKATEISVDTNSSATGNKYIVRTRVVTGEWCQGTRNMKTVPHKPGNPAKQYDSVVDNILHPQQYIVFSDAAVYPEYAIEYI